MVVIRRIKLDPWKTSLILCTNKFTWIKISILEMRLKLVEELGQCTLHDKGLW